MLVAPAGQARTVDALGLVVVKVVTQAFVFQPGTGFLHGVTSLDSIKVQWRVAVGHVLPLLGKNGEGLCHDQPVRVGLATALCSIVLQVSAASATFVQRCVSSLNGYYVVSMAMSSMGRRCAVDCLN
ncbi:hypothetical protein D9M71_589790 [compost metagenome]